MFVQEFINTTTGVTAEQVVNNSNNISNVLFRGDKYGFHSHEQRNVRLLVLCIMGLFASSGYVIALFIHTYHLSSFIKSNFLWLLYLLLNVLASGLYLEYIPMLAQIDFELKVADFFTDYIGCRWTHFLRAYVLFFSNLSIAALALASYIIVVKGIWNIQVKPWQILAYFAGFYAICCCTPVLIYTVYFVFGHMPDCNAYYFQNLPFSDATRLEMMIQLLLDYMLPFFVILFCYTKILYHMWFNSSYLHTNKRDAKLMSDLKHIKMVFFMCLMFVLTNIPYVFQLVIAILFPSVNLNPNAAVLVEILSISYFCVNPFIFIMYQFNLKYFKDMLFKLRQWRCNRSKLNIKDIELHLNGFESSQKLVKQVSLN